MKVKLKYILILIIALGLTAYVAFSAYADGPSAYVRYYNIDVNRVDLAVYWDDTHNATTYNLQYATDVTADGSGLSWSANQTKQASGTTAAYVILTNVTKYKNYYFRIYDGEGNDTIVRSFPVEFNNGSNPTRYQNDYAHGNFTPDTAMCAACHSTHSALQAQLIKQHTYYDLCMLCHGSSATQSKYDVEKGKVKTSVDWEDSLAGPIGTGITGITSKHNIDDNNSVNTSVYGSDPALVLTFTCVSCHNGHGGKNDNYRLLKGAGNTKIYPANNSWNPQTATVSAFAIVKDASVGEEVYMVSGNTEFCSACHLDYDNGNAWVKGGVYGTTGSVVTANVYKHPVTVGSVVYSVQIDANHSAGLYPTSGDVLPLQYHSGATGDDKRTAVVCSTCHFAHGTYKTFNVPLPANGTSSVASNQKMLRLDNYGVCQSCHKK
jgi:predicted CXXCH cytochrome family protein